MKNFRTYMLAIEVYSQSQKLVLPSHLKKQFDRAASSVALNLAEGYGRRTDADRKHFFTIAFGSTRECQCICALVGKNATDICAKFDSLAAHIYRLLHPKGG